MSLSLSKYMDGKAEMKFGNTWIRYGGELICIKQVQDIHSSSNGWKHRFMLYRFNREFWKSHSLSSMDAAITPSTDEEFEDIWERSEAFPKEGLTNLYDPCTDTFLALRRYCYDPNSGNGKYKRAAFFDSYKEVSAKPGIPNNAWKPMLEQMEDKLVAELPLFSGTSTSKLAIRRRVIMNSLYFPRYDFVDWRNSDTVRSFFSVHDQLAVSPMLRAIKCDGCIVLFNKLIAIAIYSPKGFMIKETPAALYEKDLMLAGIPFVVQKRLQRSQTFMV